MWEINNTIQIISFAYSVALGVIYGAFYDIFRALRKLKPHSAVAVFLEDTVYFLIISCTTFLFLLSVTNGEIRAYVLVGIILGFLLFFFTLSKLFLKLAGFCFNAIFAFLNLFSKGFYLIFGKIDYFLVSFLKNTLKCFKKGLKKVKGLLYTNRK